MLMKYFEHFNNLSFRTKVDSNKITITALKGNLKCGYMLITFVNSSEEGWPEFEGEIPYAVIEKIRVNRNLQGKGIGPQLLQEGIKYIKDTLQLYFIVLKPKGDSVSDEKLMNWYGKYGFIPKDGLMTLSL